MVNSSRFLTTVLVVDNVTIEESSDVLVSGGALLIVQWVVYAVICQFIAVFGILTNIMNIVCFVQQGFKESVNISLLGLAISDIGCLIAMFWTTICSNPAFIDLDLVFEPMEFQYLTGAWPHVIFSRVTSWITAFITMERCLCVTMPLKVKSVMTRRRVVTIITSIFIILIGSVAPVYYVNRLSWTFSSSRNRSIIGLVFTDDREKVEAVNFAVNHVFVQVTAFVTLTVCTAVLVAKLHISNKWRQKSTTRLNSVSSRDQRVTKMVVVISALFIACFIPISVVVVGMIVEPEFSIEGKYSNLFLCVCGVGFVLESTNSSMNIFIYYHMSSKYRAVLRRLLCIY